MPFFDIGGLEVFLLSSKLRHEAAENMYGLLRFA